MMQNLNLMFGSQVEKSMGITLLTSFFMRFIAELKQLHQYDLKQMGLPPFFKVQRNRGCYHSHAPAWECSVRRSSVVTAKP